MFHIQVRLKSGLQGYVEAFKNVIKLFAGIYVDTHVHEYANLHTA